MTPAGKVKARLKVRFQSPSAFISEYNHNISKGGIFIRSKNPFPVGTRVEVVLVVPETEMEVSAPGEVIHMVPPEEATEKRPAGMGVDLKGMDPDERKKIEDYINSKVGYQTRAMERRKHKRYESRIKVRFGSLDALKEEYMHNISHGGIYIRTERPKPLREQIKIVLVHPQTGKEMELAGEVVRLVDKEEAGKTGQPPGMGIRFTQMDRETMDKLSAFINSSGIAPNKEVQIEPG
ncbi:MAG: TIGR02266 family protein [bacterium]